MVGTNNDFVTKLFNFGLDKIENPRRSLIEHRGHLVADIDAFCECAAAAIAALEVGRDARIAALTKHIDNLDLHIATMPDEPRDGDEVLARHLLKGRDTTRFTVFASPDDAAVIGLMGKSGALS